MVNWTGYTVLDDFLPWPCARLNIWSYETGSAVPSRASLLIPHTRAEPDWLNVNSANLIGWMLIVLARGLLSFLLSAFRDSVHLCRRRVGPDFIRSRSFVPWHLLPTVRRHKASSSPQGSSSNSNNIIAAAC